MPLPKEDIYTIDDIYALPDGERIHQKVVQELSRTIGNYIADNNGSCEVYPAPFAVFLNEDDKNYVEPDISIICDKNKLTDKGCKGSPDWIIEIVSPSSQRMDYLTKLFKYRTAGVREYWIINPEKETVQIYSFEGKEDSAQYSFNDNISSGIFNNLTICISDLL